MFELLRRIHELEFESAVIPTVEVRGVGELQGVIEPVQVAFRAGAAELRLELDLDDLGMVLARAGFDVVAAAFVIGTDLLVVVDEKDVDAGGADDVGDLAFAAIHIRPLGFQAVRLVDDEDVVALGLGIVERAGAAENLFETGLRIALVLREDVDHRRAE